VPGPERLPQPVAPGDHRFVELAFQGAPVHRGCGTGADAHRDVQLRQRRIAYGEGGVELAPAERAAQHLLEAAKRIVVEALAAEVDQAGPETAQRIAAQHQADTACPFMQFEYGARALPQLGHRGLEQLVTRQAVEDADQTLAVMARCTEVEAVDDARHLEPQQRHGARIGVIGVRGPQAEEPHFAGQPAAPVEFPDRDTIEVARTMHGRASLRLGNGQLLALARLNQQFRSGRSAATPGAQDTQSAAGHRLEARAAPHAVALVAQECVVVVLHVRQQCRSFGGHAGCLRRTVRERSAQLARGAPHGLPVLAGAAHVGECRQQPHAQRAALFLIGDTVDAQVLPGFVARLLPRTPRAHVQQPPAPSAYHRQDRMGNQLDRVAARGENQRERIDQEGHVVGDQFDHRIATVRRVLDRREAQQRVGRSAQGKRTGRTPVGDWQIRAPGPEQARGELRLAIDSR